MVEATEKEFLQFLNINARPDLKVLALEWFLGLTGTPEGQKLIASNADYFTAIVDLIHDESSLIRKDGFLALINLSAQENLSQKLISINSFFECILEFCLDPKFDFADQTCKILSNMTRPDKNCQEIINNISEDKLHEIVCVLCQESFNPTASLNYLGPFLSNLSQLQKGRYMIMDKERCIIQRLLPIISFEQSLVKRGGIIGTLRNCCFEIGFHEWLLSPEVDILPRLLLPLAGPEEFDDDEMEKLPEDLQYLPPDKKRESDPDIRKMLIEAIHQLCSSKVGRDIVKEKQAYLIMRELHKWEKDRVVKVACENLVDLLIGDEPPENMANLKIVEIPSEMITRFSKIDEELLKDS